LEVVVMVNLLMTDAETHHPGGRCDTPAWVKERDRKIPMDDRGIAIESDGCSRMDAESERV